MGKFVWPFRQNRSTFQKCFVHYITFDHIYDILNGRNFSTDLHSVFFAEVVY